MFSLLDKLVSAIATAEGFFDKEGRPSKDHNPGDLEAAPWLQHVDMDGKLVRFSNDAEGIAGAFHQVALDVARGCTLRQLIAKWAPPSENNTENYIRETARRAGLPYVPPEQAASEFPLWAYLEVTRIP